MASRSLDDLMPEVAATFRQWVANCTSRGVEVLVYCTFRSPEEQDALYAQGRTIPGRIVTKAHGWQSWHNYRRAVDAVPIDGGKPIWKYSELDDRWTVLVEEAEKLGIEWAGRWSTFKEYVHWQITDGLSFAAARGDVERGIVDGTAAAG